METVIHLVFEYLGVSTCTAAAVDGPPTGHSPGRVASLPQTTADAELCYVCVCVRVGVGLGEIWMWVGGWVAWLRTKGTQGTRQARGAAQGRGAPWPGRAEGSPPKKGQREGAAGGRRMSPQGTGKG